MKSIDNSQDIIDSRDVINRIEELEDYRQALETAQAELAAWEGDEEAEIDPSGQELKDLKALAKSMENETDWESGTSLIRESYFEDYARQTAEDCGLLENWDKWPATCIDWAQASKELQMEYSCVEFGDTTYYYRS